MCKNGQKYTVQYCMDDALTRARGQGPFLRRKINMFSHIIQQKGF